MRSDIHPIAGVELNVFAVIDRGVDEGDRARCVLLHHELAFVRGFNHRVVNRGLTLSDFMPVNDSVAAANPSTKSVRMTTSPYLK